MEATDVMIEISVIKDFNVPIFESIAKISNRDIGEARKELLAMDKKFPGEKFIGKMNPIEIKVLSFISKSKRKLEAEVHKNNDISAQEKAVSDNLINGLSRDITFAKLLLRYLVKSRFKLPGEINLDFRKDFQIVSRNIEYHGGEEDE
jgi:hypothetical protein